MDLQTFQFLYKNTLSSECNTLSLSERVCTWNF